jgi:DUF4097 and DUF4098 domain-containing protein YvlB
MRPFILLALFAPAVAGANECRFTAQHDFDVDAAGLKTLAVALGSSDVRIEGVAGLARIEIRGKACASDEQWLSGLDVAQARQGDRLTVTPRQSRDAGWHWFGSSYAYLDLEVRVPTALAVEVHGSSGDADVRNVASLDFEASSGDLVVDRIAGPLVVQVSSGDVKGGEIGSVDVQRASSGDIQLRDVRGDVKVDRMGSGDLGFDNVQGRVEIGNVGSGDVVTRHVGGDVTVNSIGSGDVTASDVGGDFTVRAKGSGDVSHNGIRGKVSVPHEDD